MADKTLKNAPSSWRRKALLWAALWSVLIWMLLVSLERRLDPWKLVLTIPSGYDAKEYRTQLTRANSAGLHYDCIDLSSDGRLLAAGRPTGQCELWDLAARTKTAVLGEAIPPDPDDDHPALGGASQVRLISAVRSIAVSRGDCCRIYRFDGREVMKDAPLLDDASLFEPNPAGALLACVGHNGKVGVIDVAQAERIHFWDTGAWVGACSGLDWSSDGRHLLYNNQSDLFVWDTESGALLFHHPLLDFSHPSPNFERLEQKPGETPAAETEQKEQPGELPEKYKSFEGTPMEKAYQRPPSKKAGYGSCLFTPDGRYVACLYEPHSFTLYPHHDPRTNCLRFYETATGRLAWNHVFKKPTARTMAFSPDGSRLFVMLSTDFVNNLTVFDPEKRLQLNQFRFKLTFTYPSNITPLSGRWVVSHGTETWLVDAEGEYAPLRLGAGYQSDAVLATSDGTTIVQSSVDKTVRVWEKQHPMHLYGALSLPETAGVVAACIILMAGLVVIAGRAGTRRHGRKLPVWLWLFGGMFALDTALVVAGAGLEQVTAPLFDKDYLQSSRFSPVIVLGVSLLVTYALIGALRFRRGWWKFLVWYQSLIVLYVVIRITPLLFTMFSTLTNKPWILLTGRRQVVFFGWQMWMKGDTIPFGLLGLSLLLLWPAVQVLLLLLPSVRHAYRPVQPAPTE